MLDSESAILPHRCVFYDSAARLPVLRLVWSIRKVRSSASAPMANAFGNFGRQIRDSEPDHFDRVPFAFPAYWTSARSPSVYAPLVAFKLDSTSGLGLRGRRVVLVTGDLAWHCCFGQLP